MQLPTFLIIGAIKAGTTSLYYYLQQHPEVYMPTERKEARYFAWEPDNPEFSHYTRQQFPYRQLEEYAALFAGVTNETAIGEASPGYLESPVAVKNIKALIPDAKLIVSLRNPVHRHYSAYLMSVRQGRESRPMIQAIRENYDLLKIRSYYNSLTRWYSEFDEAQIKVVLFDDIKQDTVAVARQLFDYLNVDPNFSPNVSQAHNKGGVPKSDLKQSVVNTLRRYRRYRSYLPTGVRERFTNFAQSNLEAAPPIPHDARQLLWDIFEEDTRKVATLTGCDLSSWLKDASAL